jgi:hypothetical protein
VGIGGSVNDRRVKYLEYRPSVLWSNTYVQEKNNEREIVGLLFLEEAYEVFVLLLFESTYSKEDTIQSLQVQSLQVQSLQVQSLQVQSYSRFRRSVIARLVRYPSLNSSFYDKIDKI